MALRMASRRAAGQLRFTPAYFSSNRSFQSSGSDAQQGTPKPVPMSKLKDSFLDGTSSTYLEEMEERYRQDPNSVDKSWTSFFRSLESGVAPEAVAEAYHNFEQGGTVAPLKAAAISNQSIQESMRLLLLVRAYQVNGHYIAKLDPLGIDQRPMPVELDLALYGFSDKDMDREFFVGTWNMSGFLNEERETRTLREIVTRLREAYCGSIGYEYMHIPDRDRCNWLRERIETPNREKFPVEKQLHTYDRLAWSEIFESFLANKYAAAKRFGLEGCETLVPGMKAMIDTSADLGVETICLGMPHRGRLNVLANVVRKPMPQIFSEFTGIKSGDQGTFTGTGDVKYHLGTSYDRPTITGKRVHLSLLANPSHLEAVDPIVLGKVRAKQYYSEDGNRDKNMGILMHGDGSFAGQGVVYETLDMNALPDYTVGGTIHVIVNNQVAFTTDPKKSRSSPYCTDVAKALNAPILHVNGDDVESVVRACELAAQWRQQWKSDVVVDIVCYRKHGHNEIDEPSFTQPLMYQAIRQHEDSHKQYAKRLLKEGNIKQDQLDQIDQNVQKILQKAFEEAKDYKPNARDWLSSYWKGFMSPDQMARIRNTGVPMDFLKEVGNSISTLPDGFNPHKGIKRVFEGRKKAIESGEGVDWGFAEALAFGTLVSEGNHVRMSGQDVERGTFSHRHAVVHDQKTGERYYPLAHVFDGQKPHQFTICNSSLSEFGILGFELGYSMENPNSLVLWEAQFGDFANGAQVVFDQFLSSGESKWLRQTGLVVLLPHGYDGQGPEHSSCRVERFLQMADEDPFHAPPVDESKWFSGGHLGSATQRINWQIVNCTTPANYFHVLRRQIHRQFRKPLLVVAPKNLLRHPDAKSGLWEFDDKADDKGILGVRFKRLIMDASAEDRSPHPPKEEGFKRVVMCSGKVYYELAKKRADLKKEKEVAIIRLEQLVPFPFDIAQKELRRYLNASKTAIVDVTKLAVFEPEMLLQLVPFPFDLVQRELRRYPNAEFMWAQEEPMNMGAYAHVCPRLETCMRNEDREVPAYVPYSGRPPSASPATGFSDVHKREQDELCTNAMDLEFA